MNSEQKEKLTILFLLLCVSILCFWGIDFGLPGLFHSDEQALVKRALRFGGGDLNPHFFYYPTLHMYILFVAYGILFVVGKIAGAYSSIADFAHSYIRDPSLVYLVGRSLSVLPTIGSTYLVYRLGRKLFNHKVGILAGLFFISIPRVITMSKVIKPDPMMVFFTLLFFYKCQDIAGDDKENFQTIVKNSIIAGLLCGLAASFKYNAAVMFALLPLSLFVAAFYRQKDSIPAKSNFYFMGKKFFLMPLALGILFFLLGFTVGTPYWIVDFTTFKRHLIDMLSYTAVPSNQSAGGSIFPSAIAYFKEMIMLGTHSGIIGFLFMTGCIYFASLIFLKKNFVRKKEILMLLSAVFLIYLVCSRQQIVGWWYLAPAFPLYCLIGAIFIRWVFSYKNKATDFIVIVLIVVGVLDGMAVSVRESYALSLKDVRLDAKEWIEKNIPSGSRILLDVYGPQILQSKKNLRYQYQLAEKFNNPKKDYFRLQIEALPDKPSYDFWYIERDATAPSERVERSREVELFEKFSPDNIEHVKRKGFQYIILAIPSEEKSREEETLDIKAKVIKEFIPNVWLKSHHFRVKIYSLM